MRISIICPVHNKWPMTKMFLDSIYRQSHRDLELIVCDNNSSDDTWEQLKKWPNLDSAQGLRAHLLYYKPLRNLDDSNFGAARGNNICLDHVTGDIIFRSDNDVVYPRDFFQRFDDIITEELKTHPEVGVFAARPLEQQDFGAGYGFAPLGEWYVQYYRRHLQMSLDGSRFFTEDQCKAHMDVIYGKAQELVGCEPTLEGYADWVWKNFPERQLCHGGFTPALYGWTRAAAKTHPKFDDKTYWYSAGYEDTDYIGTLARNGFVSLIPHGLFFHHWGSFTREYTGSVRDGKDLSERFREKWEQQHSTVPELEERIDRWKS